MWDPDLTSDDSVSETSEDLYERQLEEEWENFMESTVYHSHEVIASLRIEGALQSTQPYHYLTGCSEVACIYAKLQSLSPASKRPTVICRPELLSDLIVMAIKNCDGTHLNTNQLIKLLNIVEADYKAKITVIFPRKKQEAILALKKKKMIALNRQQRKTTSQETDQRDAALDMLPDNLLTNIFRFLDPMSLAKAAAVNKHWQHLSRTDALWQPLCPALLSEEFTDVLTSSFIRELEEYSGNPPYYKFFNRVVNAENGRERLAKFWSIRVACTLNLFTSEYSNIAYKPLPVVPGDELSKIVIHRLFEDEYRSPSLDSMSRLDAEGMVYAFSDLLLKKHAGGRTITYDFSEKDDVYPCSVTDINPFGKKQV